MRALLVPARALDLGAGADAVEHAVGARDVLEVGLDLRLRRVAARPARVRRERELVQVRRHVAGGARVGVVVPDAADALAALEDRDVVVARARCSMTAAPTPAKPPPTTAIEGRVALIALTLSAAMGWREVVNGALKSTTGYRLEKARKPRAEAQAQAAGVPALLRRGGARGDPRRAAVDDDVARRSSSRSSRPSATSSSTRSPATSSSAASGAAAACRRSRACSPSAARPIASCTCSTPSRACRRPTEDDIRHGGPSAAELLAHDAPRPR